ncbi:MAG: ADP-ribosylation factor-like protein [Promethearchaeota archaeon]
MAKLKRKNKDKNDSVLISHIRSRFLKPNSKFNTESFSSLKELLDLPINALKGIDENETVQAQKIFNLKTIQDLAKLNPINPIESILPEPQAEDIINPKKYEQKTRGIIENALDAIPNFEAFRNHIAVAQMIERAWSKRASYLKKKETKVICVGLDNAGKTAILTGLGGKLGISKLGDLKPTKKVERRRVSTSDLDLYIWDFGGQQEYRRNYLEKPEMYFIGTDLLIYVVDMQDPERYNESFDYLIEILDVIRLLGESPYLLAFMHKADPDILDDAEFQLNVEYVADKLNYFLAELPYEYDIYTTSIYNFFTSEPRFSRVIKETLSDKESLNNPTIRKIEGLSEIIESTLNTVVSLANSLGEQIAKISQRMDDLELKVERTLLPLPETTTQRRAAKRIRTLVKKPQQVIYTQESPVQIDKSQNIKSTSAGDSRLTILNELSSLFQAKKNLDKNTKLSKLGLSGLATKRIKKPKTKETESNEKKKTKLSKKKEIKSSKKKEKKSSKKKETKSSKKK